MFSFLANTGKLSSNRQLKPGTLARACFSPHSQILEHSLYLRICRRWMRYDCVNMRSRPSGCAVRNMPFGCIPLSTRMDRGICEKAMCMHPGPGPTSVIYSICTGANGLSRIALNVWFYAYIT